MSLLTVNCIDVVTGSCRPFVRLVQMQHVFKTGEFSVRCELFFMFHLYFNNCRDDIQLYNVLASQSDRLQTEDADIWTDSRALYSRCRLLTSFTRDVHEAFSIETIPRCMKVCSRRNRYETFPDFPETEMRPRPSIMASRQDPDRDRPATRYCVNCRLSVGQCRDLFFSRWCRLSSSRGWTTAIRHLPAFYYISCHGCSQWWTPPLGSSFPRQGSSTSLRFFVSCTGWRLYSELHSNNQSSCTSVYTGPHLLTLMTSFVRWQMSRLVSNSVPVHLYHWLSVAPDSLPSVTELSRSPLHVSGTVCQISSLPHLPSQSSGPGLKCTCLTFLTPVQWL